MTNKTTITLKDDNGEVSITREAIKLEDMLELVEDAIRAHGFGFVGHLTIEELDNDK